MKNTQLIFILAVFIMLGLCAFALRQTASIKATIIPASATGQAYAVSGADTANASFSNGVLSMLNIKAGTYRIIIRGDAPFREVVKENVTVQEGSIEDLGEIRIEK